MEIQSPQYNHESKQEKFDRKRKKLENRENGSSPLKLRSATLMRNATSKLKLVVDLGSNFTKSPSKSTANALSLHSSLPQHNSLSNDNGTPSKTNGNNILKPTAFSNNSISGNHIQSSPQNPKEKLMRRKSLRISQRLQLDEVTKIYAPLSGNEYLSKITTTTTQSPNSSNTPTSPPRSPLQLSLQQQNKINSPKTSSNSNLSKVLSSNNLSGNKENSRNSLNLSVTSPNSSPNIKSTNLSPQLSMLSFNISSSPSTPLSPSISNNKKMERIKQIRKDVMVNVEYVLGKMSEYQRCILSLPNLFMLSSDILHSEYEYLVKDTQTITKILSPLDSMPCTETNTEAILTSYQNQQQQQKQQYRKSQSHALQSQQSLIFSPVQSPRNLHSSQLQDQSLQSNSNLSSFNNNNNNNNNISSQQLSEMDLVASSISAIAKKLLGIEIEIKKPSITEKRATILASFVKSVKEYLETGIVPESPKLPSEVAHSLFLTPSSETVNETSFKPESDSTLHIYKTGYLVRKKSKGPLTVWREQFFTLTNEKFCIFTNENKTSKAKKIIYLKDIVSINPTSKYEFKSCFIIKLKTNGGHSSSSNGKKLILRATNDKESALWMLALDGIQNFDTNQSCINLYIKETLLETIGNSIVNHRRSIAGGIIRSSHGEEWTYRADGTLFNTDFLDGTTIKPKELKYQWNGQLLTPSQESKHNLGYGKWNGVYLGWFYKGSPFLKYIWDQKTNEYLNQNSKLNYRWSPRGLVSNIGSGGEWFIEGNVPDVIVMFLQCLRFIRHKELLD